MYVYIYTYNAKRELMKDCKYFFSQYSEFHVFTRQSSVENGSRFALYCSVHLRAGIEHCFWYRRQLKNYHKNVMHTKTGWSKW